MTSSGGIKTRVHSLPLKEFRKRGGMFALLEAVSRKQSARVGVWWLWCDGGVEVVPQRTSLPWSSPGSAAGGGAAAPG